MAPVVAAAWPAYIHLLVVGWITQLVMGVAYWMFPRAQRAPAPDRTGWMAYGLLNVGLFCRVIAEPVAATEPAPAVAWLLLLSAALQLAAILLFVIGIWPRVRAR